jgi:hypothetical protein
LDSDIVLKHLKPLYRLDDSGDYWSSTLWEHRRVDLNMTQSAGDGSLFFRRLGDNLLGLSATYVDDSLRAGTPEFTDAVTLTGKKFDSKPPAHGKVQFTGLNIDTDRMKVSQKDYTVKLQTMPLDSKYDFFRSVRAKVAWTGQTRPDITFDVAFASQLTAENFDVGVIK